MVYNMLVTLRERCNLNSSSFSPLSYIARRSVRLIGRFAFCFIGGGERHVFPLRLSSALNRVRLCTLIRALGNCCKNPHHSPPPLAGNCAVAPVYPAYRRLFFASLFAAVDGAGARLPHSKTGAIA